jgi:hypothetical protein
MVLIGSNLFDMLCKFFLLASFIFLANTKVSLATESRSVEINNEDHAGVVTSSNVHAHAIWDELTRKYVSEDGFVNYKGFIKDSVKLNHYLKLLSANHPSASWNSDQRKAYWINAYNAFTIKLITKHYPLASIRELGGAIYKVNTPWDIKFIHIGDETYDLNNIEHAILRKEWNDPRIHAAINCASVSCPALLKGAYIADKLDQQLDAQMRRFVNDKTKNQMAKNELMLSKIFKWFSGDFKSVSTDLIGYINQYAVIEVNQDAKISFSEYDWNLNVWR